MNVQTLRRIHRRFRSRWLTATTHQDCDQCPARAGRPCHPNCPYVRQYGYPTRKDTP